MTAVFVFFLPGGGSKIPGNERYCRPEKSGVSCFNFTAKGIKRGANTLESHVTRNGQHQIAVAYTAPTRVATVSAIIIPQPEVLCATGEGHP